MTTTTIREALLHLYTAYALLSDLEDAKIQELKRLEKEIAIEKELLFYDKDPEIVEDIENHLYCLEADADIINHDKDICSELCEGLSAMVETMKDALSNKKA